MYPERDTSFSTGNPQSATRIIIFHGYTGSTDEFEALAHALVAAIDAHVSIPLLPGHGSHESNLFNYAYEEFLNFAHTEVERAQAPQKKLILMGHSFGGYLALECAAKYKIDALVLTVVPFWLRFPLNMPGLAWLMRQKLLWDKKLPLQEKIERIGLFYYHNMPGIALTLLNEGVRRVKKILPTIVCPILVINTTKDPLTYSSSAEALLARSGKNPKNHFHLVPREEHGLFYGDGHDAIIKEIVGFVKNTFE